MEADVTQIWRRQRKRSDAGTGNTRIVSEIVYTRLNNNKYAQEEEEAEACYSEVALTR